MGLYLEGIRDGRPREAVRAHTGARYTQHSTGVRDGAEGFVEFFEPFLTRNPDRDIQVVRAIEDGAYVFLHVYQSLNGGQAQWVTMDFFDTDAEGKVVEHWDVIFPYAARTPSRHTSVDGTTTVTDLELTEANKALVRRMITDVMMPGGDPTRISDFFSTQSFVQHSHVVGDGVDALRALRLDRDRSVTYDEIVLLVGQGSFVATLCRARRNGTPVAQADLFRLDSGRIVEHWDAVEAIAPETEWVNSGKF
jgi:predicted SnoaL-like aldol condensation-catalyzing enzyme